MSALAAIALGSNLHSSVSGVGGDRAANLREAVRRLGALGEVRAVSSFCDTAPVGLVAQPRFLNAAALLETAMEPVDLLRGMLEVERAMGRVRGVAKGPRVIDLDLLLYGDRVDASEELVLPHPEMERRAFVLEPLAEIAPGMVHPVLRMTVSEMLAQLRGDAKEAALARHRY